MKKNGIGRFTFLGALIFLQICGGLAHAQDAYPSRPINLLVPYPAGGFVDITARYLAEGLREQLKQPVIVVNRPGANGKVALTELVRSPADGYTLLINNDGGIGIPPAADPHFPFDYQKDYAAIAQVADGKYLITVRGTLPVGNLQELVRYARANPNKLTFGSPGIATSPHMAMEMLMRQTDTKMVHAPYPGGAPASMDLLKGVIDVLVNAVPGARGHFGTDSVRVLAVINDKRLAMLPDVPTVQESGFRPISISGWAGLFGPAGMPKPVLEKLDAAVSASLQHPDVRKRMTESGADPLHKGLDEFPGFYRSEVEKWKKFSADTGITIGR